MCDSIPVTEEDDGSCYGDEFIEQILSINNNNNNNNIPPYSYHHHHATSSSSSHQLGLTLDTSFSVKTERESMNMAFPPFKQLHPQSTCQNAPQFQQDFRGQPTPQPPGIRPRVRARRGQATDPHSIAERLRRERIAERMRALQELVPSCNKADKAAMLDEILDYVKFLRLQVKVLSMSRLGGAGAVAQLVSDIPFSSPEGDSSEGEGSKHLWDKWSNLEIEQEVARLMDEDVGSAMQYLQTKGLCIMPVSLAALIYNQPQDFSTLHESEPNRPA